MGPRRVGKTVLLWQAIGDLLASGTPANAILYVSLDTPTYAGMSLDKMLALFLRELQPNPAHLVYVFFDEIQYLNGWERHLRVLVDGQINAKFVSSGSAAAALRLQGNESGAGRFTDFILPPLTFAEFLRMRGQEAP